MTIRITGLNSGLDTDSIIQELVSAYRTKGDKIKKQQTKLSWTQDKWKSLNAKVLKLYKSLDSMRFTAGYSLKKTSVSDATKATVTASKNAKNGTHSLKIKQLASGGYLTGAALKNNSRGKAATLSSLGYTASGTDKAEYHIVGGNGTEARFQVDGSTTIAEFMEQINQSGTGVTASYDDINKRLYITSSETGKDADFTLSGTNENGIQALKALGVNVKSAATSSAEAEAWAKYVDASGNADVNVLAQDIVEVAKAKQTMGQEKANIEAAEKENVKWVNALNYKTASEAVNTLTTKFGNSEAKAMSYAQVASMSDESLDKTYIRDKTTGELKEKEAGASIDATKEEEVKARDLYDELVNNYGFKKTDAADNETELYRQLKSFASNKSFRDAFDANTSPEALEAKNIANAYTKDQLTEEIKKKDEALWKSQDAYDRASEVLKSYRIIDSDQIAPGNILGANDTDSLQNAINYINSTNGQYLKDKAEFFYDNYEKDSVSGQYVLKAGSISEGASKVDGKDAEIYLNDALFTSSTNSFEINGLNINAQAVTGNDAITITTSTDTQGLYDKIKDFITEYNAIINEMSALYNADSAKGYEPLTSDEKSALSESEVSDWEKKIKDSLLRRDSNLSSIMTAMTSAMSASFEINGKKYSLASLGIKTGGYFSTTAATRNMLHIDGDEDDETTSSNENQLMAMLNSDPDTVIEIIKGAANNLYENLEKKMRSTSLRSYQSIYNDKAMAQSYSDYTKKISQWEDKVDKIEDSYYKKFSAMETALAKLQSQQSAFAGLLGS